MQASAITAASLALIACSGTAQPLQPPLQQPQEDTAALALAERYEGVSLIRITHRDQNDLDTARSMQLRLMSERVGVGPVEYLADQQQIQQLRDLGLDLDIIADDVARHVAEERARIDAQPAFARGFSFFDDFRVFEDPAGQDVVDISDFITEIAQNNPGLVSIETVGNSIENRPIRGLTISGAGNSAEKPLIFINAGIHAREWLSPSTALWILNSLVTGYGNDPRITSILDNTTFFIIPVSNPDGYTYSHETSRFWRKNRRVNGDGTVGVDLNRNFGFEWGGLGADTFTNSDIYRGSGPFSEPETQAIRDAALARPNTTVFVDVHTYSQLILSPWGFDTVVPPEPDRSTYERLSNEIRNEILSISGVAYDPIPSHELYPASGVAGDWGYGGAGALAWTFELRPLGGAGLSGFAPEPDQIIPTGEEILGAFLHLAEIASEGVRFSFVAGIPDQLSDSETTPVSFETVPVLRASIDPSTARAMVRQQGESEFTPINATNTTGINFSAELPSGVCGQLTDLYFEIADTSGARYTFPPGAPNDVLTLNTVQRDTTFSDSFETDRGWTAQGTADTGQWERGVPANGDRLDPPSDADGNGFAYLTENTAGNSDVDNGSVSLTSPTFDLEPGDTVSFAYWIDGNDGILTQGDGLQFQYSLNGGNSWQVLRNYTQGAQEWRHEAVTVGVDLPQSSTTAFRFIALDIGDPDIIEAAIDSFSINSVQDCPTACPADVNQDGELTPTDFGAWLTAFNNNDPRADQNGDGAIDPTDFGAWLSNYNNGCG